MPKINYEAVLADELEEWAEKLNWMYQQATAAAITLKVMKEDSITIAAKQQTVRSMKLMTSGFHHLRDSLMDLKREWDEERKHVT